MSDDVVSAREKVFQKRLVDKDTEIKKLTTRLRGYETVAKLAHDKQDENDFLKQKLQKVLKDNEELRGTRSTDIASQNGSAESPREALQQELQTSQKSATNSQTSGSSASFSIIGKSSQDSHLQQFSSTNTNMHDQITDSNVDKNVQEEINTMKQTYLEHGKNSADKSEPVENSVGNARYDLSPSPNDSKPSQGYSTGNLIEEYVEVHPDMAQSGGSNFDASFLDREISGGQSCTASSRRGPMSIITFVANESMPPKQSPEEKKEEMKNSVINDENTNKAKLDSVSLTRTYSGVGARPKETFATSPLLAHKKPTVPGKEDISSETSNEEKRKIMIPNDKRDEFRVNNPPLLPYGREESQTEISALTSFGSTLPSMSPEKDPPNQAGQAMIFRRPQQDSQMYIQITEEEKKAAQEHITNPNQIPVIPPKAPHLCLVDEAQEIKNLLSSEVSNSATRNKISSFLEIVFARETRVKELELENEELKMCIKKSPTSYETGEKEHIKKTLREENWEILMPPQSENERGRVETHMRALTEANDTLTKENEVLRSKTQKLHMANKEWRDRWEQLKKPKEDENMELQLRMKQMMGAMDHMKRERDQSVQELHQVNTLKKEIEKSYSVLLSGKQQEKMLLEKLKQDYGNLHQEKRALEVQLETLKDKGRHPESVKGNSEFETELTVLKRQVSVFMEDFNKEHEEKLSSDKLLQKERETSQSLETKLKKAHTLLKSRDEDLRRKSKNIADFQFQIDDLKLKLEVEQRRASIYPSMDVSSSSAVSQVENGVFYPADAARGNHCTATINTQYLPFQTARPDFWNCTVCTFQNKISHSKCEMCGNTNKDNLVNLDCVGDLL